MKLKRRLISIVTLSLLLLISWFVFNKANKQPVIYGDFGVNIPQIYPVLGIDVSHYQGTIDWEFTRNMNSEGDSVQFVFMKATEGLDFIDDQFLNNAEGCEREELDYGAYHFFDPELSAKKQADYFCSKMGETNYSLLPVLDVEVSGDLKPEELRDSMKNFMDVVENLRGHRPIIYTYENFYYENLNSDTFDSELFWIANYNGRCDLMSKENVVVWQFSESGTVDGIENAVDLNIAKKSFFDLCQIKKE